MLWDMPTPAFGGLALLQQSRIHLVKRKIKEDDKKQRDKGLPPSENLSKFTSWEPEPLEAYYHTADGTGLHYPPFLHGAPGSVVTGENLSWSQTFSLKYMHNTVWLSQSKCQEDMQSYGLQSNRTDKKMGKMSMRCWVLIDLSEMEKIKSWENALWWKWS